MNARFAIDFYNNHDLVLTNNDFFFLNVHHEYDKKINKYVCIKPSEHALFRSLTSFFRLVCDNSLFRSLFQVWNTMKIKNESNVLLTFTQFLLHYQNIAHEKCCVCQSYLYILSKDLDLHQLFVWSRCNDSSVYKRFFFTCLSSPLL